MIVEDATHIDAAPELVWAITTDVERWPEWTPTVTAVARIGEGPFGLGSVARIRQPMQPESDWTVIEFERPRRFSWETRRPGMHLIGTHEISPDGAGTGNLLRVEARGFLAAVLWPVLRLAMGRALRDENRGLRERCEEVARTAAV